MPDLLLELYSEEIPARMQRDAADGLKSLLCDKLSASGIRCGEASAYATPRRVCIAIKDLPECSPAQKAERKGPREDAPQEALSGFLRSAGAAAEDLELREEKKGRYYFAVLEVPGQPLSEIATEAVGNAIREFVWPKSMVWGTAQFRWVRPLHSILCILHDETGWRKVDFEIGGIQAGDTTRGHSFMSPSEFEVTSFDDYKAKLERAFVILDSEDRKKRIRAGAERLADKYGLNLVNDPELLDENAGLTEWPVPMIGAIKDRFLDLPNALITAAMKQHQKYLSVVDRDSRKVSHFVMVANKKTKDNGEAMLAGNLRVLNSRLEDAEFYWKNDLRMTGSDGQEGGEVLLRRLEPVTEKLRQMNFHHKLGTMEQRVSRISAISEILAKAVSVRSADARLAAKLSKFDLVTETVKEFPELQGKVGHRLALLNGVKTEIANACDQHYSPAGPSDPTPSEPLAVVVGLADRIDYLAGFFGIGETPSGSKDPHGLRRAAIGVVRLTLDNNIRIRLLDTLEFALWQYKDVSSMANKLTDDSITDLKIEVLKFVNERLTVYLRNAGIRQDCIKACVLVRSDDTLNELKERRADESVLISKRAEQLHDFVVTDEGLELVKAFKRVNNIITSEEQKETEDLSVYPDKNLFEENEEHDLEHELMLTLEMKKEFERRTRIGNPFPVLGLLSKAINPFFERVHVNSTNQQVRLSRLRLLFHVRKICMEYADFRQLET